MLGVNGVKVGERLTANAEPSPTGEGVETRRLPTLRVEGIVQTTNTQVAAKAVVVRSDKSAFDSRRGDQLPAKQP